MDHIAISIRKFKEHAALIFDKHNNPGIKLHSIQDVLELCEYNDINPRRIQHLIIPNNGISNLDGIEKFTSLKELNLINNRISKVSKKVIEYFLGRIDSYSSPHAISFTSSAKRASFILLLSENRNIDLKIISNLFEGKNAKSDPLKYLHLAGSLEKLDIYYSQIKRVLKSMEKTLRMIWLYGGIYGLIEKNRSIPKPTNFDDYHEVVRRGMYFIIDVSPIETSNRGFTRQDYKFHSSILPDVGKKSIVDTDKLESKTLFFRQINLPPLKDVIETIEEKHSLRSSPYENYKDDLCKNGILKFQLAIAFMVYISFMNIRSVDVYWLPYYLISTFPIYIVGTYYQYKSNFYREYPYSENISITLMILAHASGIWIDLETYFLFLPIPVLRFLLSSVSSDDFTTEKKPCWIIAVTNILVAFLITIILALILGYIEKQFDSWFFRDIPWNRFFFNR